MRFAKPLFIALGLIILLAGAGVLYSVLTQSAPPPEIIPAEELLPAPDFTVYDAEGGEIVLSDFAGKPTVVNFWATWCSPCREEMPHFEDIYRQHGQDINFLMVNMTDPEYESLEKVQAFIEETGYTFPIYYDTTDSASIAYEVRGIPLTCFLDKDLNIVNYHLGSMDEATLQGYIDELIS